MIRLNLEEMIEVETALYQAIDYLEDTSCSDPLCCGGPQYDFEDFERALEKLKTFGIEYDRTKSKESLMSTGA